MSDVIDHLVGIGTGSALDLLRRSRPVRRDEIQAAYRALFAPTTDEGPTVADRFAVAAFVADLQDPDGPTAEHYFAQLDDRGLAVRIAAAAEQARQSGPWGEYREPGLQGENRAGEWFTVDRSQFTDPLAVVLEHAHLLVLHPRDARPQALERLLAAGWSRPAVVTWSQLISYVSFQVRVVAGLRVLQQEGIA